MSSTDLPLTPRGAGGPPHIHTVTRRRFATPRTIVALMLREMSTRYGQSPGGYLWAIIEPLGAILILALAFSLLVKHPALGTSFILFYATGFLPFSVYQNVSNTVARSLTYSRALLAYPAVTWMDTMIARALLNTLTGIMVTYLIFAGILLFSDTSSVINIWPIMLSMFMTVLLGVAIGSMNCLLIGTIPAWDVIWSILSRPLFLASGVFFTFGSLPNTVRDILWYNPLIHIVGIMRRGFYPMYTAEYANPTYVILLSLLILAFSLLMLRRVQDEILEET